MTTRFGHLAAVDPNAATPPFSDRGFCSANRARIFSRRQGTRTSGPRLFDYRRGRKWETAARRGCGRADQRRARGTSFCRAGAGGLSRRAGIEVAANFDRANPRAGARAANADQRWPPQGRDCFRGGPSAIAGGARFSQTLEEPPNNSLLLLLSALPQSLPDTILSRCIEISLASPNDRELSPEQAELVELLNQFDLDAAAGVHPAYRLGQGMQRLLGRIRQTIVEANEDAFKREETRYKNTTDGEWLEKREEHYTGADRKSLPSTTWKPD